MAFREAPALSSPQDRPVGHRYITEGPTFKEVMDGISVERMEDVEVQKRYKITTHYRAKLYMLLNKLEQFTSAPVEAYLLINGRTNLSTADQKTLSTSLPIEPGSITICSFKNVQDRADFIKAKLEAPAKKVLRENKIRPTRLRRAPTKTVPLYVSSH